MTTLETSSIYNHSLRSNKFTFKTWSHLLVSTFFPSTSLLPPNHPRTAPSTKIKKKKKSTLVVVERLESSWSGLTVSVASYLLSCVPLFATPRTTACQTPLPMGFSRQKYWRRLPCPPPGNLTDPGNEPTYLVSPALAGRFFYH